MFSSKRNKKMTSFSETKYPNVLSESDNEDNVKHKKVSPFNKYDVKPKKKSFFNKQNEIVLSESENEEVKKDESSDEEKEKPKPKYKPKPKKICELLGLDEEKPKPEPKKICESSEDEEEEPRFINKYKLNPKLREIYESSEEEADFSNNSIPFVCSDSEKEGNTNNLLLQELLKNQDKMLSLLDNLKNNDNQKKFYVYYFESNNYNKCLYFFSPKPQHELRMDATAEISGFPLSMKLLNKIIIRFSNDKSPEKMISTINTIPKSPYKNPNGYFYMENDNELEDFLYKIQFVFKTENMSSNAVDDIVEQSFSYEIY